MLLAAASIAAASADSLIGEKKPLPEVPGENYVHYKCISDVNDAFHLPVKRDKPWSLPSEALAADFDTTIHVLVLRYNFQYETTDDPNTTGRGVMDLSNPLATPADSAAYYDSVGHWIDPPPHDSAYFDAQMQALNIYWQYVSEGKVQLTWDIYPPGPDSVYTLPREMSHYGRCDSVVVGLEYYFQDCIHVADSVSPEIDFSNYQAFILFHAGSDRQNDIGFPPTCNDLFTGFIKFGDSVGVDNDSTYIRNALMMPETACQDNRATALNAVMVHEFGHQLGLVDLYNTRNFLSLLGDFALMDNNGFGTGIDFGFAVGNTFGAIPIYASAWSRAYLGFTPVVDFRRGEDIRVVAAEVQSSGIRIARVPISENEYYLIENRVEDTDQRLTAALADSATGVILGPGRIGPNGEKIFTGEYDFLLPGSGMLIYRVDESVAAMDFNGDGQNNFEDNTLQWDPDRPFIKLIEGDGLVNFGGFYRAGYGKAEDMFRDDRATEFTPRTNPQTIDNTGNDTHIYITNIRRDSLELPGTSELVRIDTVMFFDVNTDRLVEHFPIRAGYPLLSLAPIADDLDRDGTDELIVASGNRLVVMTSDGQNFIRLTGGCMTCPPYIDTTISSVNPRETVIPLYAELPRPITCGPVTGDFGDAGQGKLVAVGFANDPTQGQVWMYLPTDSNQDARADGPRPILFSTLTGVPIALSFGDILYALTDAGMVYRRTELPINSPVDSFDVSHDEYHGICRIADRLVVLGADDNVTSFDCISGDTVYTYSIEGNYNFGPIVVDMNRDGQPEVVAFSEDGDGVYVTIDTTNIVPSFSVLAQRSTGYHFTTNPMATDVDLDGYADIVIGGTNKVYGFNRQLILLTDFPLLVDDRFPETDVIAPPVTADIDHQGGPDLIFPTEVGNLYSYGLSRTYGFPLSAGELGIGSSLIYSDSTGGKLAYLGADGWFYAWEVNLDTSTVYWPMNGHDPSGSFAFDQANLIAPSAGEEKLPENRFFAYPNPTTDGTTTIRYFLGDQPTSVTLAFYDLSGYEVDRYSVAGMGNSDNEFTWNCSGLTPGVYRCVIEADFGGDTQTAFTDVAVIN